MKAGRLEERRPDSRAKSRWGCRWMNPISIDSSLPIVLVMGGWVKKWYMKAICRLEADSVSRDSREMGDGESLEEGTDRDKRDMALVYTRRHPGDAVTRMFPHATLSDSKPLWDLRSLRRQSKKRSMQLGRKFRPVSHI